MAESRSASSRLLLEGPRAAHPLAPGHQEGQVLLRLRQAAARPRLQPQAPEAQAGAEAPASWRRAGKTSYDQWVF